MSQVIRSKNDLKIVICEIKKAHSTIGLVPTMGALHQGHLSLIRMSKAHYDVTVATIFVNPAQFNNKEDLHKYPRTEQKDISFLSNAGCDFIFIPSADDIYANEPLVHLNFGYLEHIMEGKHRPGHFNGVGLIVMKLFGLIEPTGAYFGQKDLQQFIVISILVNDFELPIKLHLAPIVREPSGLAMSSRNKRLTKEQLKVARSLYTTLKLAKHDILRGKSLQFVQEKIQNILNSKQGVELEYFEIVQSETLQHISTVNEGDRLALCLAIYIAEVRLIDNLIIEL